MPSNVTFLTSTTEKMSVNLSRYWRKPSDNKTVYYYYYYYYYLIIVNFYTLKYKYEEDHWCSEGEVVEDGELIPWLGSGVGEMKIICGTAPGTTRDSLRPLLPCADFS